VLEFGFAEFETPPAALLDEYHDAVAISAGFSSGNVTGSAMPQESLARTGNFQLVTIKVVHTLVWAIFAACIIAIPVVSWLGNHRAAAWLAAIVAGEVAVLVLNRMRCPLTDVAARHTGDRRANFDIYLPEWLARYNKLIFGVLYAAGLVFAFIRWRLAA